ncbi:hypothetical protein [Brytella acorum]|uniref:Uncharacterized protein n=1 Tax=Brytella acorum TaxID=2959299 RepID=A0AA35XYU5_9PROT|nr:hypothetical protein [Brytella acorum]MDF3625731.1 hypothetical protein [Brytella acorum]CAI9121678.1 hypothetical protein LMG32879_002527 [Brytella acorum]
MSGTARQITAGEAQEPELNEDALREALGRMGSGRKNGGGADRKLRSAAPPTGDVRRRRFVQDGQVVVEHHQNSRATHRAMAAPQVEDHAEIDRLKAAVREEQRRHEESQRRLQDVQTQMRSLETRAVHADLRIKELQAFLQERDIAIMNLRARLAVTVVKEDVRAVELENDAATTVAAQPQVRRGRPRKVAQPDMATSEPEPVKWWVKD